MGANLEIEARQRLSGPTEAIQDRFFGAVREGFTKEAAAALAGVSRSTLSGWQRKGAAARDKLGRGEVLSAREEMYAEFVAGLEFVWDLGEAKLHGDANDLAQAGKSTWTQPVTVLERTRREKWGRRSDGEIVGRVEIIVEGRPPREPSEVSLVAGEEGRRELPALASATSVP